MDGKLLVGGLFYFGGKLGVVLVGGGWIVMEIWFLLFFLGGLLVGKFFVGWLVVVLEINFRV